VLRGIFSHPFPNSISAADQFFFFCSVIGMLMAKGYMELEETLMQWKQKTHLLRVLEVGPTAVLHVIFPGCVTCSILLVSANTICDH